MEQHFERILEEKLSNKNFTLSKYITFKNKHEINTFSDIQNLKEFITNRDTIQEILKEFLRQNENVDIYKGMNTENSYYVCKYKRPFSCLFKSMERIMDYSKNSDNILACSH